MSLYFNRIKFATTTSGTAAFTIGAATTGFRSPSGASIPDGAAVSYTAQSADLTQWETGHGTYHAGAGTISRDTPLEGSGATPVVFTFAPLVWLDVLAQDIEALQISARVSSQFNVTSSAALANVPGLSVNVVAGRTYSFNTFLYTSSNASGGVQFAIAGTATATSIIYNALTFNAAVVSAQTRATALATSVGGVTNVVAAYTEINGTITVNAAGTLTVQFAQNASFATQSSMLVGSFMLLQDIT